MFKIQTGVTCSQIDFKWFICEFFIFKIGKHHICQMIGDSKYKIYILVKVINRIIYRDKDIYYR